MFYVVDLVEVQTNIFYNKKYSMTLLIFKLIIIYDLKILNDINVIY